MSKQRLVVIGGVAGGMSAAAQARRMDQELDIVVFEAGEWISYSACGLPYLVGRLVEQPERLVARTVEQFAKQGIEVKLHHRVIAINAAQQVVEVIDQTTPGREPFTISYDRLVIATGARPIQPEIEGLDLQGVFNLHAMTDALAMLEYIDRYKPQRAVIVGGGYIGLEAAENLHRLGLKLTVVQRPPQLFSNVDREIANVLEDELKRHDVDLSLCDSLLYACYGNRDRVEIVQTSHGELDADLVVLSVGVRPNVELARVADIKIGGTGAIAVDDHQRTNWSNIYAAGDCSEHLHRMTGKPSWVPLGTTANKQGRIAGENAAGGDVAFKGIVGTAITRAFNVEVGRTGMTEAEAHAEGKQYASAVVDSTDIAGYYPGAEALRVKVVAERGSGRLLGGQVAGGGGVDKRIDVLATALHAGLTVEELAWIDLGYSPPFNSVWDPLHIAARNVLKEM
jgi:NADPH-dependent 2,4-dienoyl-CoA reductase/sulfur reductase-like enzyme